MTPSNLAPTQALTNSSRVVPTAAVLWWVCLIAGCALLLFPLLLTDVPPVLDYPNHLARLMILADNGADPILARFFIIHWGIIPDLGIDAVGPLLMRVFPVHVAGRIVLGIVLLLPVLGTIAYSRAVFGRATWWSLGSVLVAYNACYLQGFLNFTAGTGLALLLASDWLRGRDTAPWRTLAIAIPGTVVLFFCHLMGVLFYALLIGTAELARVPVLWRRPAELMRRALYGVAIFVLPAVLYVSSELKEMTDGTVYLSVQKKIEHLQVLFANYALGLDLATAGLIVGGLVLAAATGRLRAPARSAIPLLLMATLYAAAPAEFKGTNNLDMRFVIYAGFLMFGAVAPAGLPVHLRRLAGGAAAALFVARMVVLSNVWLEHNQDLARLRAVIAYAEPGSAVFVTDIQPVEEPAYWAKSPRARWLSNELRMDWHLPALLLIERRAWWPYLFTNPSQQPVLNRPAYDALGDTVVYLPHRELRSPERVGLCGFDRVLLMIAGAEPDMAHFAGDRLTMIAGNDTAAIYKIAPNPACPPAKR